MRVSCLTTLVPALLCLADFGYAYTVVRTLASWSSCTTSEAPNRILWTMAVSADTRSGIDRLCPLAPQKPISSTCSLHRNTTSMQFTLTSSSTFGVETCSTFKAPGYDVSLSSMLEREPFFFPESASGPYLIFSDAYFRSPTKRLEQNSENKHPLGQICMPYFPDLPPRRDQSVPPTATLQTSPSPSPTVITQIQAFHADGVCRPLILENGNATEYWKAVCNFNGDSSTSTLWHHCEDPQCRTCNMQQSFRSPSDCAATCVFAEQYKSVPLFGWGSPLLNAFNADDKPTSTFTTVVSPSGSDYNLLVVAGSISAAVVVMAGIIVGASFYIVLRRKKLNEDFARRLASSSSNSAGSIDMSADYSTSKALAIARKQYRQALRAAEKEQRKRSGFSGTGSHHSQNNSRNGRTAGNESKNDDSKRAENERSAYPPPEIIEPEPSPIKFKYFESDTELNVLKNPHHSVSPSMTNSSLGKLDDESNGPDMFFKRAILTAAAITKPSEEQPQAPNRMSSPLKPRGLELNHKEFSAEVCNVVMPAADCGNPQAAYWGTPESQINFLADSATSPPLPKSPLAVSELFDSIPPIMMASETKTMVTTSRNQQGDTTKTVTTISRNLTFTKPHDKTNNKAASHPRKQVMCNEHQFRVCKIPHAAEQSHEIDLQVGDKIKLIGGDEQWSVGVNSRTGSEGTFPTKCIEP